MKLKAKRTLKNAYDQVLFVEGKLYEAEGDKKRVYILNELHSETVVRIANIDKDFERVDSRATFKVGHKYESMDGTLDPITVMARTSKSILARNSTSMWRMFIWNDEDGSECVTDSKVPSRWRWAATYKATLETA